MEAIATSARHFVARCPVTATVNQRLPAAGRLISGSSQNPHIAMLKPSPSSNLPGLAGRRWPSNEILASSSMQLIARRYQRTPIQVWQRYQIQRGIPGANSGSDEHRSSINTFALTMEDMKEVEQALAARKK